MVVKLVVKFVEQNIFVIVISFDKQRCLGVKSNVWT